MKELLVESITEKKSKNGNTYFVVKDANSDDTVCVFDAALLQDITEGTTIYVQLKEGSNIAETIHIESWEEYPTTAMPEIKPPKEKEKVEPKEKDRRIADKHIVKIQGNDFVTFNGVLNLAHEDGLQRLEVIDSGIRDDEHYCVARATFKDGRVFEACGSCNKLNSAGNIGGKWPVELAQTRAFGRALRFAMNLDMVLADELDK